MSRWRIDWTGDGVPEAGQLVRHVTPNGACSYARVLALRVVNNRRPLPDGVTCRYAMEVRRLNERPMDEAVKWTCYAHSRSRRHPKPADVDVVNDLDAALWAPTSPAEEAQVQP